MSTLGTYKEIIKVNAVEPRITTNSSPDQIKVPKVPMLTGPCYLYIKEH